MILVLDTNVLISAILSPHGPSAQIIRLVLADEMNLAVSKDMLDEAYRFVRYPKIIKLMKKHSVLPEDVDSVIERLSAVAVMTSGALKLDVVEDDPSDNMILACALESEADFIVSGDRHLTELKEYQGIMIFSPAAFLSFMQRENPSE